MDSFIPHGYCLNWQPGLLWTLVGTNLLTGLSYFSIPLALMYFRSRQPAFRYNWVLVLFSLFIFACGASHLVDVVSIWKPVYRAEAGVMTATAIISLGTAVLMWPLVPRISAFLDGAVAARNELQAVNEQLRASVQALERSERRFRQTLEHSAIGLALVGLDGSFLSVNPALCRIVGYSSEELLAVKFQTITHPDDLDVDMTYVDDLLAGRCERYSMEKRYFHKNGSIVDVQLDVTLLREPDGTPVHFISQIQDISERKRTASTLADATAELEMLYEDAPVGYHTLDRLGYVTRMNRTELNWLGYSRDQVVNRMCFADLLTPDSRQAFWDMFPEDAACGDLVRAEHDMQRRDGSVMPVEVLASPETDDRGSLTGYRVTLTDISERRRGEAMVRHTAERMTRMLENLQTGVVVHAADSAIEYANPAAQAFLGLTHEQLLGKVETDPYWRFIRHDGSTMPVDEYPVNVVRRTCKPIHDYEVGVVVGAGAEPRWALVNAFPDLGERRELRQVIISFVDITERKQLALELQRQALTDALTQLPNRRHFLELTDREWARARRSGCALSLLMVDLDHFKSINDRWGHGVGDQVLRAFADCMRPQLRDSDVLGRLGGEEFAVLLPETALAQARDVAERLRQALAEVTVEVEAGAPPIRVTASFGLVVGDADIGTVDALFAHADQAMYAAKRAGRNRICVAAVAGTAEAG